MVCKTNQPLLPSVKQWKAGAVGSKVVLLKVEGNSARSGRVVLAMAMNGKDLLRGSGGMQLDCLSLVKEHVWVNSTHKNEYLIEFVLKGWFS